MPLYDITTTTTATTKRLHRVFAHNRQTAKKMVREDPGTTVVFVDNLDLDVEIGEILLHDIKDARGDSIKVGDTITTAINSQIVRRKIESIEPNGDGDWMLTLERDAECKKHGRRAHRLASEVCKLAFL